MPEPTTDSTTKHQLQVPPAEAFQDVISVAVDQLHTASWNEGVHYDDLSLQELGMEMRNTGQLQPILVRAHPTIEGQAFEVISGEKRHRAAKRTNMAWLNAHFLHPCDDITAQRISYRAKAHQGTSDLYTATTDVLNYLASEYATTPGWSALVERESNAQHAAAWIIRKSASSFPYAHPDVADALEATQDEIAGPLRFAFREGNPHGSIASFAKNRLRLLTMHPKLLDHVRTGQIDLVAAIHLNRMPDEKAMLALIDTGVANNWTRDQILKAARPPRRNASSNNLKLPTVRSYQASLGRFTEEDKKAAAEAISVLHSLISKYESATRAMRDTD